MNSSVAPIPVITGDVPAGGPSSGQAVEYGSPDTSAQEAVDYANASIIAAALGMGVYVDTFI